jgi:hypothetical protein
MPAPTKGTLHMSCRHWRRGEIPVAFCLSAEASALMLYDFLKIYIPDAVSGIVPRVINQEIAVRRCCIHLPEECINIKGCILRRVLLQETQATLGFAGKTCIFGVVPALKPPFILPRVFP